MQPKDYWIKRLVDGMTFVKEGKLQLQQAINRKLWKILISAGRILKQ